MQLKLYCNRELNRWQSGFFSKNILISKTVLLLNNHNILEIMRYALYEEIPIPKEDVPPEKQLPPIPAFERYASISKTKPEIRRDRYNAKLERLVSIGNI